MHRAGNPRPVAQREHTIRTQLTQKALMDPLNPCRRRPPPRARRVALAQRGSIVSASAT